ncbi:MAG: hypothetical protein V4736_01275 [Bdellovibrionota bacterium]
MSAFKKALDALKFDKRMIEGNMNRGSVSKEDLEKHLKDLPDMGSNIDLMSMNNDDDSDSSDQTH